MCGICGVVQIGGEPREVIAPGTLDHMTDAMTHRGPNDRGIYQADGVAFGVRRLSIVDVEAGHQPFANETGDVWGMQNGELYNHEELRRELVADGHVFDTRCDTEILPHLYERYGTHVRRAAPREVRRRCLGRPPPARRRRARPARRQAALLGAGQATCVVFASELKSLLASRSRRHWSSTTRRSTPT